MSQLKKGALLSLLNIFFFIGIGIVLTPFIIKSLGSKEYGLYTLIGSVVSYLSLLDLGLNNAIIRYIAKYRVQSDTEGERKFLGTCLWLYLVISIILVSIGLVLYNMLDSIFSNSLDLEQLAKAKIMFLILVLNLAITLPGGAFQAICIAYENFVFPRFLTTLRYVVRACSIFTILTMGGKAISIVIIDTIINLAVILCVMFYVFRKMKVKLSLCVFDQNIFIEIYCYSFWVFIYGITHLFQWSAGQVILGITTSTAIVGFFGVGVMLGGYYTVFSGAINGVLIPRAVQMVVSNKTGKEITETITTIGRLNVYLLFLILSGFFLFGRQFIILWIGPSFLSSWRVAFFIMIGMTLPLLQVFGNTVLEAKKKNRFKSVLSLSTSSVAIVLGYYFSKNYSIDGMVYPLFAALIIDSIVMNFYFVKIFKFDMFFFLKEALLKQLIVYGALTTVAHYTLGFLVIDSWFHISISVFIYSVIYILVSYLFLMNTYEKSLVKMRVHERNINNMQQCL